MYLLYNVDRNSDTSQSNSNIKNETDLWSFLKKQNSRKIPVNQFNEEELKCKQSIINLRVRIFAKKQFKFLFNNSNRSDLRVNL
jgi:hypothetical protein